MLVHTPEAQPVTDWVPFADWADGTTLLDGRRPTEADVAYHLTTLFPPVRPREWLEIRYLRQYAGRRVARDRVHPGDPTRRSGGSRDATAAKRNQSRRAWDRAARVGLGDARLHAAAIRCVETAAERAPDELRDAMERLLTQVELGRSPADDFSDRVVALGIATAVSQLAESQS